MGFLLRIVSRHCGLFVLVELPSSLLCRRRTESRNTQKTSSILKPGDRVLDVRRLDFGPTNGRGRGRSSASREVPRVKAREVGNEALWGGAFKGRPDWLPLPGERKVFSARFFGSFARFARFSAKEVQRCLLASCSFACAANCTDSAVNEKGQKVDWLRHALYGVGTYVDVER